MKKLAAVDLDGTLIDTLKVNAESYRLALQEKNISFSDEEFRKICFGRHYLDFLPDLMGKTTSAEDIEYIHERKKEFYPSCVGYGKVNTALTDILSALRATGEWNTAVVTTGSRKNAYDILNAFGCTDLFDLVVTSADVKKNKPDPEGYLKAMEYFGVSPENTLIFEDSGTGLTAAMASGARVFRIEKF